MTIEDLQQYVERYTGKKLKIRVNNNRSTMLSVKWEAEYTKVSMHKIFLEAPPNVMDSLACYISQEKKRLTPDVKAYMEDQWKNLDYSHQLDRIELITEGNVYNLNQLYDEVNDQYFEGALNLKITWFGARKRRLRRRVTFGTYNAPLELIKINRLIDEHHFPRCLVKFIVYHEMLHHVCPSYVDERGIHRIHTKEFRQREKEFFEYDFVQRWLKNYGDNFFTIF